MCEQIKQKYEFDFVHDAQMVFRELLSAMSNPGQIKSIQKQAEKFHDVYAVLTTIGCTMLDNEEAMYVEKNPALFQELQDLTMAKDGDLREADYIFLSSEMNYGSMEEILRNVKKGTYEDPQDSATMVILCQELNGKSEMTLTGPGVDKEITLSVNQYLKTIVNLRQRQNIEYPLGVDLIFADPHGDIMGIPRLIKAVE